MTKTNYNGIQDERLRRLESCVENINERITIINHNSTDQKVSVAKVQSDVDWLKKFFWIIAGASISSLIGIVFQLVLQFSK